MAAIDQQKIINDAFDSEPQDPIILKYVDKKEYKKLLTKIDNITIPDKEKYNHIYKLYFPIWLNVKKLEDLNNVDNWYICIACSTLLFAETDLYFVKRTHKQIKLKKLHLTQYKDAINKKYWQVPGINNLRLHQLIAVNYLEYNDVDNWIKGHIKATETKKRFNELKNKGKKRTTEENDEFNKISQRINEWNIDHINGDKNNNLYTNLQIITHKDNLSKRTIKNDSCVYEWNPADIIPLKTVLRNKDINVDFYYITKNNIYKIIKSNRVNNRKPHTVINNGTKTQLYRKLEPFNGIYMLLRSVDKDNKSKKRVMVEHDDIEKIYNINRNGNNGIKKTEIEDNEELNKMEEDYLEDTAE